MTQTPQVEIKPHAARSTIRTVALCLACFGFLIGISIQILDMSLGGSIVDRIPGWLAFPIVFLILCYGAAEIRFLLNSYSNSKMNEKGKS